ncbi:unnamed protein product [Thlaspi arvense]|uniref:Casein kinase II subunit beta n=1 Tax=Thlaspi arvense TaxID=13288 RepID=A0AAU9SIF2_THLAR|nr:unnamed protein product [Thlaspi arvense]
MYKRARIYIALLFAGLDSSYVQGSEWRNNGWWWIVDIGGAIDRKRINDALDKHLKKSSPSTSMIDSPQPPLHSQFPDHRSFRSSEDTRCISWFGNLRGNEFFCEVDEDYIYDDFSLCGLSGDMFTKKKNEMVQSAAEMLYALIHVRYILSTKEMAHMN